MNDLNLMHSVINPLSRRHGHFVLAVTVTVLTAMPGALAAPDADQTLETVTLASADGNTEGAVVAPLAPNEGGLSPAAPQAASLDAPAAPALVVGTTKIGIPLNRVGSLATVVTRQQIQQMQATSLLDVLRRVPGVDVVQSGGLGQTASIFIRGMNAEHTMVLVDGIEVNDPISPGRTFNFPDQISLDSVDRIEILRGPQSQLYGSDAIGGVINIITETGADKTAMYVRTQGGAYGTVQGDADVRGNIGKDKFRYTLHGMKIRSNGYSAASSRYGNPERDGFQNNVLTGRVSMQPLPNVSMNFLSTYANSKTDLDNFGGYGGDDPNYQFRNKSLLLGGRSRVTLLNNKFEQITRFSVSNQWRRTQNDFNPGDPFSNSERSRYNSHLVKIDNYHVNETNTLTGGAEITNERGDLRNNYQFSFGGFNNDFANHTATNVGLYFQDYIQLCSRWYTTAGVRWDEYNRFGHATTYRGASTFLIPETGTTLRTSYGTGFKAPTLYQMYAVEGNQNLNAEKSKGWDVGVEQKLFRNSLVAGATYYHNGVDHMIQYNDATFLYQNIGKAQMKGSEVYTTWTPCRWLTTRASYTATIARNLVTDQDLVRRPRNKFSINMNIHPTEKFNLYLDITHIGVRSDLNFANYPVTTTKLNPYTLINLALSYKLTKNCTVFGRLMNILDTPYETVKGYGSPRIAAYGGFQLGI